MYGILRTFDSKKKKKRLKIGEILVSFELGMSMIAEPKNKPRKPV